MGSAGSMCVDVLAVVDFVVNGGVYPLYGGVAQMVERSLSMREVLGSIPSFSRRM